MKENKKNYKVFQNEDTAAKEKYFIMRNSKGYLYKNIPEEPGSAFKMAGTFRQESDRIIARIGREVE